MLDPSRLCQMEISVHDPVRAMRFYGAVFGWVAVPADLHNYHVMATPPNCHFGIALVRKASPATASAAGQEAVPEWPGVVNYFECDDPEAIIGVVGMHGGKLRSGPITIPGYGRTWQIIDTEGNTFGIFQAQKSIVPD